MKKILLYILMLTCLTPSMYADFRDFQVQQQAWQQKIDKSPSSQYQQSESATSSNNNCQACSSNTTSRFTLPPLTITIQDANNNILYATSLIPNANFTVDNAILAVDIFPPSNPSNTADASYYVVCTLKTMHGSILQKQIQPTPLSFQAPVNPLLFSALPTSICVYTNLSNLTPNNAGIITIPSSTIPLATSTFLPTGTGRYSTLQQIQLLNLLCPISQQFLIQQSLSGLKITNTAGTLQSANNSTFITLPPATPTNGQAIAPIGISISDGTSNQTLQFSGSHFNAQDLKQGLYATLHVFPPSTNTQGNYFLVATIKTLDGLKFRKQILTSATFTGLPVSLALTYGAKNSQPILTYNCLDINLTSQSILNTQSPLVFKMLMQLQTGGTITALVM